MRSTRQMNSQIPVRRILKTLGLFMIGPSMIASIVWASDYWPMSKVFVITCMTIATGLLWLRCWIYAE